MMNIGDFARIGGVSARMLRHYDAIGLLAPAYVDPLTGHRLYEVEQVRPLNRILALKTLGFSLAETGELIALESDPSPVIGMLRLRAAELRRQIRHEQHVLARVTARLRLIEEEETALRTTIETKTVDGLRVVGLMGAAKDASRLETGPVVKELFERVGRLMDTAQADRTTPIAFYMRDPSNTGQVLVRAGYVLPEGSVPGLESHIISEAGVASVVHRGAMKDIASQYQRLATWAEATDRGRSLELGRWREIYLEANGGDESDWIIELQLELH